MQLLTEHSPSYVSCHPPRLLLGRRLGPAQKYTVAVSAGQHINIIVCMLCGSQDILKVTKRIMVTAVKGCANSQVILDHRANAPAFWIER